MWVYISVYAHTHTQCTDGVLGCEPRGRDTWRARRIQMDQISAYIYSDMCTKYIYVCIYQKAGWDLGLTSFFLNINFVSKKKSRRCERKPMIISNLKYKIWAHRLSIKGTKPPFIVTNALIIILTSQQSLSSRAFEQPEPRRNYCEDRVFSLISLLSFRLIMMMMNPILQNSIHVSPTNKLTLCLCQVCCKKDEAKL